MQIQLVLIRSVDAFCSLLELLIFVRIILSWFPMARNNPKAYFIYNLTEPILGPIRKLLQDSPLGGAGMMLDFSPIIAFFLLNIASMVIKNIIILF